MALGVLDLGEVALVVEELQENAVYPEVLVVRLRVIPFPPLAPGSRPPFGNAGS